MIEADVKAGQAMWWHNASDVYRGTVLAATKTHIVMESSGYPTVIDCNQCHANELSALQALWSALAKTASDAMRKAGEIHGQIEKLSKAVADDSL